MQWRVVIVWLAFTGILALFSAYASTVENRYLAPMYAAQVALVVVVLWSFIKKKQLRMMEWLFITVRNKIFVFLPNIR